ncbi:hypothetical protein INT47_001391, partial [Mucor saturninus]
NIKKELKTIDIAAKLSALLACDDPSQETVYKDAFDGELYAKFGKDGHFDNKYDIALKIDIDGFRSKFSRAKMTMINCVILNYDISERFTQENTFQIGIVFGKVKVNLNSYLRPIIKELCELHSKPLLVKRNGQQVAISRVTAMYVSGDGAQYDGEVYVSMIVFAYVILLFIISSYEANNDYNINLPSVFADLVSITSVAFHPIDEMHLYSNIANDVFFMFSPKYNLHFKYCGKETDYPFELSNNSFTAIKKSMEGSR